MIEKAIDELADNTGAFVLRTDDGEEFGQGQLMIEIAEAAKGKTDPVTIHFTGSNAEYSVIAVPLSELERFGDWLSRMARRWRA